MILSHTSYPLGLVWWLWWKSQGVIFFIMEVQVWYSGRKKQSFHLAFLFKCFKRSMFSAFSTYHMITWFYCMLVFFHAVLLMRSGEKPPKGTQWKNRRLRQGCGLQRASGARRSGPGQKFTEIWHTKMVEIFFRWTISDLCCRSKAVSFNNNLGSPWPKITSCFSISWCPMEVFHAFFRHLLEWSWGCWATGWRQVLQCSWNLRYIELIHLTTATNISPCNHHSTCWENLT